MNERYFTQIRKDVLHNTELSLGAKGLYCLICYDVTKSLRRLLLDPTTRDEVIECSKELEKFDYAHFNGLEEVKIKIHILVFIYLFNLLIHLRKK